MTLCVYALATPVAGALRLRGLDREPLHAVTVGRVTAVVGRLRRPPPATHAVLARYDAVVRRLFERYSALLPARFATYLDRDEIDFILRSRQALVRRALRAVRGRAQMTVRFVTDPAVPAAPASRPSGREYLRQRSVAATIPGFASIRAAVTRWVRDERIERRDRIVTVYHLIPRGAASSYHRAMVERTERSGLRAVVTGPYPPYAFTGL